MAPRRLFLVFFLLCCVAVVASKPAPGRTTQEGASMNHRWRVFKSFLHERIGAPIIRRLAAGVYAIGRFFDGARKTSLQSLLPRVGEPAVVCERLACSVCTAAAVPSLQFNKHVCLELALRPRELGVGVRLILDGSTFTEYQLSWKRSSDVKLDLGGIYNVFFRARLYNNHFQNNTLFTCASLELDFPFNSLLYLEMGCYHLGTGGVGRWKEEEKEEEEGQEIDMAAINRQEDELIKTFYEAIEDDDSITTPGTANRVRRRDADLMSLLEDVAEESDDGPWSTESQELVDFVRRVSEVLSEDEWASWLDAMS